MYYKNTIDVTTKEPENLPENPLNYVALTSQSCGVNELDEDKQGTQIAILGAGSAGLCAAYELMRAGITPIIFEASPRIGGRCYTEDFEKDNSAFAELGAMRIPTSQKLIFKYLKELGIEKKQGFEIEEGSVENPWPIFPSPGAVDTRYYYQNKHLSYSKNQGKYYGDSVLIQQITLVESKFNDLVEQDLREIKAFDKEYNNGFDLRAGEYQSYVGERLAYWRKIVSKYKNKSLYQALVDYQGKFGPWLPEEIELLGAIGIGTGGIGSLYNTAYLETLRETYHKDDTDQRMIVGGVSQLTDALWNNECTRTHNLPSTSVAQLNNHKFHRKIVKIQTAENPNDPVTIYWHEFKESCANASSHSRFSREIDKNALRYEPEIIQENGKNKLFQATFASAIITCSLKALETSVEINDDAFSKDVWHSIRRFSMVSSQKLFVLTKSAFWNEWNDKYKHEPLRKITTTLSDHALKQSYFFDKSAFGKERDTDRGVALLSYTWDSDATALSALSVDEKWQLCLRGFEEIYGQDARNLLEKNKLETKFVDWDTKSGYNGAFRMASPGQYDMHLKLAREGYGGNEVNNGLFLAGEALSWYGLSGWIEGALHTGINSAIASIKRVNNMPKDKLVDTGLNIHNLK